MKRSLRKQILSIFVIILCLFLVACGTGTGGGNEGVSKKYNEANYQMDTSFTFEKTLTLEEVKTAFELYDKVIEWYDNFKLEIPTWYKGVL